MKGRQDAENNNNNNNNNNRFISSSILVHGSSPRNLYVVCMLDVFTNFFFFHILVILFHI